ncbi:DUF4388 domain-containing protein [Deinococcus fonticola]|uniref:DUF4388 domain-containing protein n=1 Tax=Deinococcus fonticola TaxID=2528713 RepID=UPI0010751886|nr:DUF4388 domain-containing protein [Deinococcus fonticola]
MQGLLSDLPLLGLLELIHATRQTGVLEVESDLPFTIAFQQGQIVSGGILDWLGTDALHSCSLLPTRGKFQFRQRGVTGQPLAPYDMFTTEWARVSDEWAEVCTYIGSPSRLFSGDLPLFNEHGGRSIRAAARKSNRPLLELSQQVAEDVRSRRLRPTNRFAWFGLLINPDSQYATDHPVTLLLDGERNLGEIVDLAQDVNIVREYLLQAIQSGLRFQGSGWVLRDLIWENQYA